MKKVTFLSLLLLTLSFFGLQAQSSSAMDAVDDACKDIVQMNGDLNSMLNGVRPTSMNPATHTQMVAFIGQLSPKVSQVEAGLSTLTTAELVALKGQLNVSFSVFVNDASNLCGCVTTGDLVGANNMANIVRSDFQALRLIASDIRAEIQKAKGKS